MTSTRTTPTVRLSGRGGLLAAIPALLGFHPDHSLVLVCSDRARRTLGPIMRVDIDAPLYATATYLAEQASSLGSGAVAVVAYAGEPERPQLLDQVLAELDALDIPIMDSAIVFAGAVRPGRPHPEDPDVAVPVPTDDDPQVQQMEAISAYTGRGVLPDRAAVARSVQGPVGEEADRIVDDWLHLARTQLFTDPPDVAADKALSIIRWLRRRVVAGYAPDRGSLLQLSLLLIDADVQGQLLGELLTDSSAWTPIVVRLVAALPDLPVAPLSAVLGVLAYHCGDGALAQIAVDRAMAGDPGHALAHTLLVAMTAGCPPSRFTEFGEVLRKEWPQDQDRAG